MLRVLLSVLAFYAGGTPAYAQTVGANSSQLLSKGPGAEAAALGGAVVSTVHDPTSLYWNPAGLAASGGMVSGEHLFLYDGARYDFIGLSVPSRLGTFGLGALQLNRDGIVARQSIDDPGYAVSNTQSVYMLGLGRALTEHWSVGATANVLDFNLAGYKGKGWGLDTGAQGAYPEEDFWGLKRVVWSFGADIKNLIQPKITLVSDTEAYPREIRGGAGLSFQTASRASSNGIVAHDRAMIVLSERTVAGDPSLYPGIGLAYDYQNILVFRLGYDGAMTAGVGFHTPNGRFTLDYSMENQALAINNRFTISFRFLQTKAKPQEKYAEEIDDGYTQAKTAAAALARENSATGERWFKEPEHYRQAMESFRLASLLAPEDKAAAVAYHRAQEAYRRQEIFRLSTDATLDPATGQEEQAYFNIAELLDLGADNRADILRRLGTIRLRLQPQEQSRLSQAVLAKRLEAARRLTGLGAVAEAMQIEDTMDVFASSEAASELAVLKEQTQTRGGELRKAFEAASAEERPTVALVKAALAARRAFPDDAKLGESVAAALARYRGAYPLSMKETFYLRKLYYLAASRYARRAADDVREAAVYLGEIERRDPADEFADTLLDAMAREGLARE
ncbi:MAG: hypothetical protein KGJ45_06115 [Elusimicrobia bacterium]|nr:hypothetical protein [Elusimicrobiota bacterium]